MKHSFFIIITFCMLLAIACKKGSNPAGNSDNRPPGSFTVTIDSTDFDPVLYWTVPEDPDGDPVTYSIYLEGREVEAGLSDTTAILGTLEYETGYSGRVVASDGKGGSSEADFSFTSREIRMEWEVNLGGRDRDIAASIQPTADGGYLVAGQSNSSDGDVSHNHGGTDYWLVKLDNDGNLKWEKTFGGSADEFVQSIVPTADGGFIVAGSSQSSDGNVGDNKGDFDCWIVKLR